jgi:hypothetical protein
MNILLSSLFIFTNITFFTINQSQNNTLDIKVLIGNWKLDMSPENKTDSIFASMKITKVTNNSLEGFFYREGVEIRDGRINTQTGTIYAALVSGDNGGEYNSTFYYKDGILFGTTHSLSRDFLSVWTATKLK